MQGKGLQDLESGSTNYLTEYLAYGADDELEEDDETEEDLRYLNDPQIKYETKAILLEFLQNVARSD